MKAKISIFFILLSSLLQAQDWNLLGSIDPKKQISSISIDNKGLIYAGLSNGNIIRYTRDGEEEEYFSVLNNSSVTTIQAWNRLKVFSFFRDQQTVSVLDRFTTTPKNIELRDLGLSYAWLFAPGVDNSYWALSTELKELVKYDDQNLNVLFRLPLKSDINIDKANFLRAYKNLLIVVDEKSGIWVFDQYGNLHGKITEQGIRHIEIKEDLIYTTNGSEYLEIDPFKLAIVSRKKAPKGAFWSVVISGDNYIFFSENKGMIYTKN